MFVLFALFALFALFVCTIITKHSIHLRTRTQKRLRYIDKPKRKGIMILDSFLFCYMVFTTFEKRFRLLDGHSSL